MPRDDAAYERLVAEFESRHGKVRRRVTRGPKARKIEVSAEVAFEQAWLANPVPGVELVREFRFHPTRGWRFDAAFPAHRVAVELDGWGSAGHVGRHHTFCGAREDCAKYTAAAVLGWRLLRFMSADKDQAAEWVLAVHEALRWPQ